MKTYILYIIFTFSLVGCTLLDPDAYNSAKHIFQAWEKQGASIPDVKDAMRSCGYKDLANANDLTKEQAASSETCMSQQGYRLNLNSYKPNNCYGPNSPYLCNRLWGGNKPVPQSVLPK